jgi:hypothetical protein
VETEALLHLVTPLKGDRGGAQNEDAVDALAQHQLLEHQPRLDGLPQADVIGDEEVDPRELQRLLERGELVIEQVNASAERGLKEARVGRCDRAPLQRVEVRGEVARLIEARGLTEPPVRGADDPRTELALPEHREGTPLRVVIEASQADEGVLLEGARRSQDFVDEVLAVTDLGDVAGSRH